jgi:hypothetical protein
MARCSSMGWIREKSRSRMDGGCGMGWMVAPRELDELARLFTLPLTVARASS